ncbi:MAG: hypothetical protein NT136_00825 [Candidatus Moranbacteria bacterium]|nr:hypothetical protein [Candidatus Moranbacteria bacterium]
MKAQSLKLKAQSLEGFTLIEALVLLFIFSLITVTFYSLFSFGIRYIQDSKNRLGALAVANEKMEIVRNLKYDDIGTVDGEVEGNIPQDETVIENGRQYNVHTLVEYVQDSFDGMYPNDTAFEDYKRVTVTASWNTGGVSQREVKLVSRFVPPGLEVANPGNGILSVNVFSDQPGGTGIPNSVVHISNPDTGLNTQKETDASGNATFMGDKVTESIQKYEITVTKTDYETVNTLPPYSISPFNPVDVHASVVIGSINVTNIVQNKLASLEIATVDYLDQSIDDISFHLTGGRKIGTEVEMPNDPIYNLNTDSSTDSSGEKDFDRISPGQYKFYLASSVTDDYELIATDPSSSYEIIDGKEIYSTSLYSDQSLTWKVKLADKNITSIIISILRSDDDSPISGAQVNLKNSFGYDRTQTTSANGKVFFPTTSDPFQAETYDIKVTADGFKENNSQSTVNTNELKVETIKLTAQ